MSKKILKISLVTILSVVFLFSFLTFAQEEKSKSEKGWMGIYIQKVTPDLVASMELSVNKGILVSGVVEDSPAEEAGLEEGDVILSFEGREVKGVSHLSRMIRKTSPEETIRIKINRDGEDKTLSVKIGKKPKHYDFTYWPETEERALSGFHPSKTFDQVLHQFSCFSGGAIGVTLQDLNKQLGEYFGVEEGKGVLITEVNEDGPAFEAGLRAGDVIVEVDGEKVEDVTDVTESLSSAEEGDKVKIEVLRKGQRKTFSVEIKDKENLYWGHLKGLKKLKKLRIGPEELFIQNYEPLERIELVEEDKKELEGELEKIKEELKELRKELKELKKKLR